MRRCLPILLLAVVLASCGGPSAEQQTSEAFAAQVEQTTTAAEACTQAAVDYGDEMKPITDEWADALKLATQTARNQLADQIAALQAVKRKADAVTVPACAEVAHDHLVASMNASIDSLLAFMSQKPETEVTKFMGLAADEMAAYTKELAAATSGPQPTAAPDATATPAPEVVIIPDEALPGILWADGDLAGLTATKVDPTQPFKGGVTSVAYDLTKGGNEAGRLTLTLFNTPKEASGAVLSEHTIYTSKNSGTQFPKITDVGDLTYASIGESPDQVLMARCTVAVRLELKAPHNAQGLVLAGAIDDRAKAICLP